MRKRRYMVFVLTVALLLVGCSIQPASGLYCLPDRFDGNSNLSAVVQNAMAGLEYAAPIDGSNRQSVQMADLNGDGRMEYLVYARKTQDQSLRLLIFTSDGEQYSLLDSVNCSGTDFDRVEYVQMDNAIGCEIVIGCKVGDEIGRSVVVYSMIIDRVEAFLTTSYTNMVTTDLNQDGHYELVLLRSGQGRDGVAVLYAMNGRAMEPSAEVPLSVAADQIIRIIPGMLQDGCSGVYVEGALPEQDGVITDVLIWKSGRLENVTFSPQTQSSDGTYCSQNLYARDMDEDGVLELPRLLPMQTSDERDGQYLIQWYSLTEAAEAVVKCSTYHNYTGGWYLELDSAIAPRITVVQTGSSFEFDLWNEDFSAFQKLMTVYVLTGQRREEQAVMENRFVLYRTDSTVYAAELEVVSSAYGMSKQRLIGWFHLILDDALTGVN